MASPLVVHQISKCTIKPQRQEEEALEPLNLTQWDLIMLTGNYIQTGLLFSKPPTPPPSDKDEHQDPMTNLLQTLKQSLSHTLVHFFPLSGLLATKKHADPLSYTIYIDCTNTPGAEFIHAIADATVSDILTPLHVPDIVKSFFAYNGAVNHDGHTLPLLAVQVTELVDGFFIGCSVNHVVGDGTSFWHFMNTWSEISKSCTKKEGSFVEGFDRISHPPIIKRWFPEGYGPIINLPFTDPSEFIDRFTPPVYIERIFHFSPQSMAQLKDKANDECENKHKISSFQSLCGLLWRSVIRARHLPHDQRTVCLLSISNRSRLEPPLSEYYLGNSVHSVYEITTVGTLMENGIGWAARVMHQQVGAYTHSVVRKNFEEWVKAPKIRHYGRVANKSMVVVGGSSRFDSYGNDFGWGKPLAVRSGCGGKFDGKVSAYPGREGGGSVDLVACLSPETMIQLEKDEEFMGFVSNLNHS